MTMTTRQALEDRRALADRLRAELALVELAQLAEEVNAMSDDDVALALAEAEALEASAIRHEIEKAASRSLVVLSRDLSAKFFARPGLQAWLEDRIGRSGVLRMPAAASAHAGEGSLRRPIEGGWLRLERSTASPHIWYVILEFNQMVAWRDAYLALASVDRDCLAIMKFRVADNRRAAQGQLSEADDEQRRVIEALASPNATATLSGLPPGPES
jgi:hypothetical protein